MSRESASIAPREAAITASLAGAVVVVLAYASGFGLRPPLVAAPVAPVPSSPTAAALPSAAPVPVLQPAVRYVAVVPAATASRPPAPAVVPTPGPPHRSAPVPSPPAPTPSSCPPGVLTSVLAPVGDLLDGLLGVDVLRPGAGLLDCTVGSLLGPTCCDPAVTAKGAAR